MSRDITQWQVQDSNLRRHTPTDLQSVYLDVWWINLCW